MKHPIHTYGDPVLRKKARPVPVPDVRLRRLAEDMLETMRAERGVGLAAQQIGLTDALCVIQVPEEFDRDEQGARLNPDVTMPLVLVNPVIVEQSREKDSREEGCLSFPGINGPISRSLAIRVTYADLEGVRRELRAVDFLARVIQHEVDHLNGVLFIDRMSRLKRIAISGQLKRMKKETETALGTSGR